MRAWNLEVFGPLLFWTLMFIIAMAIKVITFSDYTPWFQIAPEASLWAAGILFAIAVSEQTYFPIRRRLITKQSASGYALEEVESSPERNVGFTPRFIYMFLIVMALWLLTLLLGEYAAKEFGRLRAFALHPWLFLAFGSSVFLAAVAVWVALTGLREVAE
jgi:hypothetical protein